MNFSTNTWSIGIRIEHIGSLELSLEGFSVSKKTVRPSRSSKTTTYQELIQHILITTGKFQSGRDQLILRHYWVFKFLQGYNYWEYEFSPHFQNKILLHKTLTIDQVHKGQIRKSKVEQITCSRSSKLFPEIRGRFGKLKVANIIQLVILYLHHIQSKHRIAKAQVDKEYNYWNRLDHWKGRRQILHLNISAKSQIVNRMNCRTNKHGQIQEYLGKTSQAQLDNLIEEQVRQSATSFIQQQNSYFSVLDEDMTADHEGGADMFSDASSTDDMYDLRLPKSDLNDKQQKALELHMQLNGSQLRSDV